ncbi:hypothetical protein BKH42_07850 [Helicobacter sp. 13S00482-2]|nr:hypothetical protein BKH42_07850 [Helicobacter sp. 13S00482-2]
MYLLFILVSISDTDEISDKYQLDQSFEKYFTKENCSLVIKKYHYINCYSFEYKSPKAIAYEIEESISDLPPINERARYRYDTEIPAKYRTYRENYISNKYRKCHILGEESMHFSARSKNFIFLMSNMAPQRYELKGMWQKLLQRERRIAKLQGNVQVLNILLYPKNPSEIEYIKNGIAVPKYFIKIIKSNNTQECYALPNEKLQNQDILFYTIDCEWFI